MQSRVNSQLTLKELSDIRSNLPHGSMVLLATKHGFTQPYISRILHGKAYNFEVICDAAGMAVKEKERQASDRKSLEKKIAQLSK